MKKSYLIYCICIEDITKLVDCYTCPHYDKSSEQFCKYKKTQNIGKTQKFHSLDSAEYNSSRDIYIKLGSK